MKDDCLERGTPLCNLLRWVDGIVTKTFYSFISALYFMLHLFLMICPQSFFLVCNYFLQALCSCCTALSCFHGLRLPLLLLPNSQGCVFRPLSSQNFAWPWACIYSAVLALSLVLYSCLFTASFFFCRASIFSMVSADSHSFCCCFLVPSTRW